MPHRVALRETAGVWRVTWGRWESGEAAADVSARTGVRAGAGVTGGADTSLTPAGAETGPLPGLAADRCVFVRPVCLSEPLRRLTLSADAALFGRNRTSCTY